MTDADCLETYLIEIMDRGTCYHDRGTVRRLAPTAKGDRSRGTDRAEQIGHVTLGRRARTQLPSNQRGEVLFWLSGALTASQACGDAAVAMEQRLRTSVV
jgi:hypothetical protein